MIKYFYFFFPLVAFFADFLWEAFCLITFNSSLKKLLKTLCLTASALSVPPYALVTVLLLLGRFLNTDLVTVGIPWSGNLVSPHITFDGTLFLY